MEQTKGSLSAHQRRTSHQRLGELAIDAGAVQRRVVRISARFRACRREAVSARGKEAGREQSR